MNKILLKDGEIHYSESFFTLTESDHLFTKLLNNIQWGNHSVKIFGKLIPQPRLTAFYGNPEVLYTYSGLTLHAIKWTEELQFIKSKIESASQTSFNCVLLNLYRDGRDYIGWHSDAEGKLGQNPLVGSVSFGSERRFKLKHIKDKTLHYELPVKHGTYLLMGGTLQHHWKHMVPKTAANVGERINLTFRNIIY